MALTISSSISPFLSSKEKAQEKIFTDVETCSRMLRIFQKQMLSSHALNCTFQRSSLGGTGFTFLCCVPATVIEEKQDKYLEISTHPIEFVLKWEDEALARNEQLCAFTLKHYGFSTPDILICPKEVSKGLVPFAHQACPAIEAVANKLTLIAMSKFHASNFKHAVQNKKIYQLSAMDQCDLFEKIAEIVPFDFFIANNDRIIRFSAVSLESLPKFNMGNLMIEFYQSKLHRVHYIDNCTTLELTETKKFSGGDEINFSFLDGATPPSDGEVVSISEPTIDPSVKIERLHKIFKEAICEPHKIAQLVGQSLQECLDLKLLKISQAQFQTSILNGISGGIKKLIQQSPPSFQTVDDPFNLHALHLIKMNIQYLTSIQEAT